MRRYLLQIENVMVEIILQLLVCIVDAELLEAVGLKVLKAKNVQNTDGQTLHNSKNSDTDMRRKKRNLTRFKPQTYQDLLQLMIRRCFYRSVPFRCMSHHLLLVLIPPYLSC